MKFRKKPLVVEATQWFKSGDHPAVKSKRRYGVPRFDEFDDGFEDYFCIDTLEGEMKVWPGDWIITGVKGEHYACNPDIFEQTYERVED